MKNLIAILSLIAMFAHADETAPPEVLFSKKKLQVGNQFIMAEIAETDAQMERGLMYRKSLADNAGMLFAYKSEQTLSFWMKNTFIPLSIGFFDSHKRLVDIQEMAATSEIQTNIPTYQSKVPAMYALEEPANWFANHKIAIGTTFKFVGTTPTTPTNVAPAKATSTKSSTPKPRQ